jgi:hypothetical protein
MPRQNDGVRGVVQGGRDVATLPKGNCRLAEDQLCLGLGEFDGIRQGALLPQRELGSSDDAVVKLNHVCLFSMLSFDVGERTDLSIKQSLG